MFEHLANLFRKLGILGGSLGFVTLLAWLITVYQVRMMTEMGAASSSMGDSRATLVAFLLMWIVMIVAMMFPSAAPTILSFNRLVRQPTDRAQVLGLTGAFVMGYMIPWTIFGLFAYLAMLIGKVSSQLTSFQQVSIIAIPLIAGLYQFTPLKKAFLGHHQTRTDFMTYQGCKRFREAFSMGIHHGNHCIGTCWGLMLVLLAFDVMNLVTMVLFTIIIFVERMTYWGFPVRHLVGVGLMGLGIWTAVQLALTS